MTESTSGSFPTLLSWAVEGVMVEVSFPAKVVGYMFPELMMIDPMGTSRGRCSANTELSVSRREGQSLPRAE